MAVVADATVLQDTWGLRDIMLEDRSLRAARLLQAQVNSELRAKGYQSSARVTCTGVGGPRTRKLFVSNDPSATDGPELTGAHQLILHTPVAAGNKHYTMKRLFERLHSLTLNNQKAKKVVFPEVDLLQMPKGQYIVLVSALARNVNLSKQLAQGLATAALYLGQSADYQKDVAEIRVVVIDPTTRTPVWRNEIKGEVRNEEEAKKEIGKLFKDFPAYKGNAANSLSF